MALPNNFKPETGQTKYTMGNLRTMPKVKIRVLSDFITGKCVWGEPHGERVCTRVKEGQSIPVGAIGTNRFSGQPERIKQFVAAVVYNYTTEQVEIFETDKATIIGQLVDIEANEDWGDSKEFDLTISKAGEDMDTKYSVLPSNKSPFKIKADFDGVDLNALYRGEDPFSPKEAEVDTDKLTEDVPF